MSTEFRRAAQQLAAEVARVHEAGPGLPVADIGARSRRARRRHEATLMVTSGAAIAVLVLGAAALVDRGGAAPPAAPPSETSPTTPTPTSDETAAPRPTATPTVEASPDVRPPTPEVVLGVGDLDRIALDPLALAERIDGLGELVPGDASQITWGLDPAVEIYPSEACRPALTVVVDEPTAYRAITWGSPDASVSQEVVVLSDTGAARSAFAALGASLGACPEYGASLPESSGAWHVVESFGEDAAGLSSYRVAGSELGEGNESWWVQVDVLVANVVLRTEVFLFDRSAADATDADEIAEVVETAVQAALEAR